MCVAIKKRTYVIFLLTEQNCSCNFIIMDYKQFKKMMTRSWQEIFLEIIAENRESIRIKKEKTVIKNLDKIFKAALKISNKKGFQAMSMRDLRQETGISLGALYAYFTSKDDLLTMLQSQGREIASRIIDEEILKYDNPLDKIKALIRTHVFLSEIMQPWFYFSFMEAKNLNRKEKEKAIEGDLATETLLESILEQGQQQGAFVERDVVLTAEMIKALFANWYLKRSKFRTRGVSVDKYADFVIEFVEDYLGVETDVSTGLKEKV